MREAEYFHDLPAEQLNGDDMSGAKRVDHKNQTKDDPDDIQGLAFDEHPGDIVDDVKN
jgi:hypothetical protein